MKEWVTPKLLDALRDAPSKHGRLVAANVLWAGSGTAAGRRMIADGGAMGLVLALLVDVGQAVWDKERWGPAWDVADDLLRWETAAVHDLQHALCGPQLPLAWITRAVLEVCYGAPRL
jgi:hypothetical protein